MSWPANGGGQDIVHAPEGDYPPLDVKARSSSKTTSWPGVVLGLLISTLVFVTGMEHPSLGSVDAAELGNMGFPKTIPILNFTDNIQNFLTGLNNVEFFLTGADLSVDDLIGVRAWEYNRMVTPYTIGEVIHPGHESRGPNGYTKGKIHIKRGGFAAVRQFDINSYWGVPIESRHSHFFHEYPGSLVQVHRFKLPVSEERQKDSCNSEYGIERNIPERKPFKITHIHKLHLRGIGLFCFYWGRYWRAVVTLIVAGVLAHASLSFLLFGNWLCC